MRPPSPSAAPCQGLMVSTFAIKENKGDEGQGRALVIISKRNKPSESLNVAEPCFGEAALQEPPAQGSRLLLEHLTGHRGTQSLGVLAGWDRAYPQALNVRPKAALGCAQCFMGSLWLSRAKSCMLQA